jgi:hypothetical protein
MRSVRRVVALSAAGVIARSRLSEAIREGCYWATHRLVSPADRTKMLQNVLQEGVGNGEIPPSATGTYPA